METKMAKMPLTQESLAAMVALYYQADADFRAEFDKDPKAALSKVTGLEIPASSEVVVHRNDDRQWHISLPSAAGTNELKDEDISSVFGGFLHNVGNAMGNPRFWGRSEEDRQRDEEVIAGARGRLRW